MVNQLKEAFEKASPAEIEEVLMPLGVKTFPELYKTVTELREISEEVAVLKEQKQLQEMNAAASATARKELSDAHVTLEEGVNGDVIVEAYQALSTPEKKKAFISSHLVAPLGSVRTATAEGKGDEKIVEAVSSMFPEKI